MNNEKKLLLTQYASAHGLVDLVCAASLFTLWHVWSPELSRFMIMLLVYNVLAFGLQAPFGLLVDRMNLPKQGAVAGCLLTATGVLLISVSPWLTIAFLGIGNAVFHVGGGSVSLNLSPYKAVAPGIFVAPGAIGLAMGTLIGKGDAMFRGLFFAALLLMGFILWRMKIPKVKKPKIEKMDNRKVFILVLALILLVVYARALIGFSLSFSWKQNIALFVVLVTAISLGKGAGGLLAEKFGWIKTGLFGLVVSAPLMIFFSKIPLLAIIGAFVFQFTMPITLTATYRILPHSPAFAFGLPCLALLLGALPVLLDYKDLVANTYFLLVVFILAIFSLYFALKILSKSNLSKNLGES